MKFEIASLLAVFCCSLFFVSTSAIFTCAQHELWNVPAFRCRSGNVCVFTRFECDSILDCGDHSDEDHCEEQHRRNCNDDFDGKFLNGEPLQKFTCRDGMCILGCKRCDNTRDCIDGSDEESCTGDEVRPPC